MDKLNSNCDSLWQRPRRGCPHYNDLVWYEPRVEGHDPLECFMKHMSKDIQLQDQTYTNHCIRSTVLNNVCEKFEACHAMGLSGHKSESSLKQYAVKYLESKKKEMFDLLSDLMQLKLKQARLETVTNQKSTPAPPLTQNSNQVPTNIDFPSFEITPLDFETIDDQVPIDILDRNE